MEERELTLDEIVEEAMGSLGFGPEALACCEPDGRLCSMEPEELELARASIVYMGYRLLLTYRMKRSGAYRSAGGGVAISHFASEIRKELACKLGICGTAGERIAEVKRLYGIARQAEEAGGAYRVPLGTIMQGLEAKYGLDANSLGIVFI